MPGECSTSIGSKKRPPVRAFGGRNRCIGFADLLDEYGEESWQTVRGMLITPFVFAENRRESANWKNWGEYKRETDQE